MDLPVQTILLAALPVFLLLLMGVFLRRMRILTAEADTTLTRMVVLLFLPSLLLDSVIGNSALEGGKNLISAPLVGFLTVSLGFVAGLILARAMGLVKGKGLRTFAFVNGIYNFGFIPIPLVLALFDSRETLGVLLVHNVGVEIALWTVGIVLLSGNFDWGSLKRLINPPVVALAIALTINFTGSAGQVPDWLFRLIKMLGACAIPIGVLLAGASVADLMKGSIFKDSLKVPLGSIGLRLMFLPVTFIAAAALIPGISLELKQVMIVQAAMPAGIFQIVISRHYGGDVSVAVKVVLATTFACIVTMPIWIKIGAALVLN